MSLAYIFTDPASLAIVLFWVAYLEFRGKLLMKLLKATKHLLRALRTVLGWMFSPVVYSGALSASFSALYVHGRQDSMTIVEQIGLYMVLWILLGYFTKHLIAEVKLIFNWSKPYYDKAYDKTIGERNRQKQRKLKYEKEQERARKRQELREYKMTMRLNQ